MILEVFFRFFVSLITIMIIGVLVEHYTHDLLLTGLLILLACGFNILSWWIWYKQMIAKPREKFD